MSNSTDSISIPTAPAAASSGFSLYLLGCALVAALGGLLFGFDTAVISGTTDWLKAGFVKDITAQLAPRVTLEFMLGFTVASALIGTIVGSIAVGKPADIFGRREVLFVLAILYLTTSVGCALAWNWSSFVIFRFLGGLAVGGASVVSPMYIAEISPARYRGRLVAVTQFNVIFGILLAYLSNAAIGSFIGGEHQCRWMFGVMAAPSLLFFFLLFLTPQSPRWLMAQRREAEARVVLLKCGSDTGNVDEEICDIRASLGMQHHTLREPFFCRKYLKPITLAVAIAAFNQLSGINAVLYYTPAIFKMAGVSDTVARWNSVSIGFTMLVFTLAALAIIDHFGRRRLMFWGSLGYIASLGTAAWAFFAYGDVFTKVQKILEADPHAQVPSDLLGAVGHGPLVVLISLMVYVAAHGFGQGAVIWVFISEIFPNRVRARGQALGSFTHWGMDAAVSWTFPMIAALACWTAFAFYALCMVVQLVWVLAIMPETKGVSLEKIQKQLEIE